MEQKSTHVKGGEFLLRTFTTDEIFIPEDFSEQQIMIAQTTEEFIAKEVLPRIHDIEEMKEGVAVELLRKAGELGLLSIDIPEAYGGLGLDKTSTMLASEKIGPSGSWAVSHGAHTGIGTLPIVYFGTEEQKKKYLPKFAAGEWISSYSLSEAGSGSDALSARTTAVLSKDRTKYILNGTKMWLSNAGFADVYITFAKIDGEKFTAFIIEKDFPGVSTGAEEKKLGIKGSSTRTLILENAEVPVENVLGEIGRGHIVAFNILNIGRFKLAASVIGAAKTVIGEAVKYAKTREQFNSPIANFGLIKHKLAEMVIRTYAGESMVYRTAGAIDAILKDIDSANPEASKQILKGIEEYAVECAMLKVYCSEILDYVVDEAVQIFGGYGYSEEYPVARAYRDSRINRIFEGTNEINRLLTSGMLLKRSVKGEIPLLPHAKKLFDDILGGSRPMTDQPSGELLAAEQQLIGNAKNTVVLLLGAAGQKYLDKIADEQEVLGAISDMMMETYAMESALARGLKTVQMHGAEKSAGVVSAIQVLVDDGMSRIDTSARLVLARIAEGDMLRTYMTVLKRMTRRMPVNSVAMRREIADRLAEAERYTV
ncbi:MAG: acyl-CoA dehydrogenase [Ignavibacteria bacterium]|nr:acyl-CoA dehydrogenase [Ignavibacteria bacterium]